MNELITLVELFVEKIWGNILELPDLITSPYSRIFLGYLLISSMIGLFVYLKFEKERGEKNFFQYLLPHNIYKETSFYVDIKFLLFRRLIPIKGFTLFFLGINTAVFSGVVAEFFPNLVGSEHVPTYFTYLIYGVLLFAFYDLARYVSHFLHHKIKFLWAFHEIHHSPEQLNVLTTYRFHPVEKLIEGVIIVFLVGGAAGIMMANGATEALFYYSLVSSSFYALFFNMMGGALRHSHIWVSWGKALSHVLISPAQHQIHHSKEDRHLDMNYGVCLAIWDWIFGTLYYPETRESFQLGVRTRGPHTTLTSCLIDPFYKAFKFKKRSVNNINKNQETTS